VSNIRVWTPKESPLPRRAAKLCPWDAVLIASAVAFPIYVLYLTFDVIILGLACVGDWIVSAQL
jgi:hypothetical protein